MESLKQKSKPKPKSEQQTLQPDYWTDNYDNFLKWTNEPECTIDFSTLCKISTLKDTDILAIDPVDKRYAQLRRNQFKKEKKHSRPNSTLPRDYNPYTFINPPLTIAPTQHLSPMSKQLAVSSPHPRSSNMSVGRLEADGSMQYFSYWGARGNINDMEFIHVPDMISDSFTHTWGACIVLLPTTFDDAPFISAKLNAKHTGIIIERPLKHPVARDHEVISKSFESVLGNGDEARKKAIYKNYQIEKDCSTKTEEFIFPSGIVCNNMNFNREAQSFGPDSLQTRSHVVHLNCTGIDLNPTAVLGSFVSVVVAIDGTKEILADRIAKVHNIDEVTKQLEHLGMRTPPRASKSVFCLC